MIISVNWLKKFVDINLDIKSLSELIGSRLVEIEEVIDYGKKYQSVIVAKVVECNKLEGSNHLHVTKIDDGGKAENVERDDNGLIQVVCGAPNVKVGLMVAYLPPKSIVPETFNSDEPTKLDVRKMMGYRSSGMLASATELDLYDNNDGILEIDKPAKPGDSFAKLYELDDYLLDIENKSLTHRPDCFGIIGFAREIAIIQGKKFVTPKWFLEKTSNIDNCSDIKISIDDSDISDRYQLAVVTGAKIEQKSNNQIASYLYRCGIRPINAIVDITNYLMLLTGLPLHAFDYDKLLSVNDGKCDIHIRLADKDEKIKLLDGKDIQLDCHDIVVCNGKVPVALAGAMGGFDTKIDNSTNNIAIESANYNLYNIRGTQMRHGIFSDAITRFTKGQPAELTTPVINQAIDLLGKTTGASLSMENDCYKTKTEQVKLDFSAKLISSILGDEVSSNDIKSILENGNFVVNKKPNDVLSVEVPFWRKDINIVEDIAEEIGRVKGFDNINLTLPSRQFMAVCPSYFDTFKSNVRKLLARSGANEVLNYSFVKGDDLKKINQNPANSYRIVNSISPELQYYRQSLMLSLLEAANKNLKVNYNRFNLFEINKVHSKTLGLNEEHLPNEAYNLGLIVCNKNNDLSESAYFTAKKYCDFLFDKNYLKVKYMKPEPEQIKNEMASAFDSNRVAVLVCDDKLVGFIGEFSRAVKNNFKMPEFSAGLEINIQLLSNLSRGSKLQYKPVSRYQTVERDVCFRLDSNINYGELIDHVLTYSSEAKDVDITTTLIDIYQTNKDTEKRNITIRFNIVPLSQTLSSDQIVDIMNKITLNVCKKLNAEVI